MFEFSCFDRQILSFDDDLDTIPGKDPTDELRDHPQVNHGSTFSIHCRSGEVDC